MYCTSMFYFSTTHLQFYRASQYSLYVDTSHIYVSKSNLSFAYI